MEKADGRRQQQGLSAQQLTVNTDDPALTTPQHQQSPEGIYIDFENVRDDIFTISMYLYKHTQRLYKNHSVITYFNTVYIGDILYLYIVCKNSRLLFNFI